MATDPDSIRGRLRPLSIADVLEFLRSLNRIGVLTLSTGGVTIWIYLRRGRVIHATSTRAADRLIDLLLRWNLLDEESHARALRLAAGGERIGKALVATGALSPRALLDARDRQVRQIVLSSFEWEDGTYDFTEREEPDPEAIAVDLDVLDLVVEGIRTLHAAVLFKMRLASRSWVYEAIPPVDRKVSFDLEPHERYVLELVDGRRDIGLLIRASQFPEEETLRVLFMLGCLGYLKRRPGAPAPDEEAGESTGDLLAHYNGLYERIHGTLMAEVGPIASDLLDKTLRETRDQHPRIFDRTRLGGDGTLDGDLLRETLQEMESPERRQVLIAGLNELLYAQILVLRRTLGEAGERRVLKTIRRLAPSAPPAREHA